MTAWISDGDSGSSVRAKLNTLAPTLTAATDIAAGSSVSIDADGHAVQTWGPAPVVDGLVTLFAAPSIALPALNAPWKPGVLALSATQFIAFLPNVLSGSTPFAGYSQGVVAFSRSGDVLSAGAVQTTELLGGFLAVAALDATHFVMAGFDPNDGFSVQAASISGNVISLGAHVVVDDGGGNLANQFGLAFAVLSASKFLLTYASSGGGDAYIIGTVSGTTVTLGSPSSDGLPVGQSGQTFPIALTSTSVVLAWADPASSPANKITADVGAVSGTTLTLSGSPQTIASAVGVQGGFNGVKVDATHFCLAWQFGGTTSPQFNATAAVGEITGGEVSFGAEEIVIPAFCSPYFPAVAVLGASALAFYGGSLQPTLAILSGNTLTVTPAAPLPISSGLTVAAGAYVNGQTAPVAVGSTFYVTTVHWPPLVAVGSNLLFTDGAWNIYEGLEDGAISQPIAHPGYVGYAFAPIDGSQALALLIDATSAVQARVVHFEPVNEGPVGYTEAGAGSGDPVIVKTSGLCAGFSGLTTGKRYYANGDGTVTAGNVGRLAGVAVSATELLLS